MIVLRVVSMSLPFELRGVERQRGELKVQLLSVPVA